MNLPPYPRFPELSDESVLMRQIVYDDIEDIISISFYNGQPASNVEEAVLMDQKIEANYQNGDTIHWGIMDKSSQKIVGTCGFYRGFANGFGELGCVLLPQFRKLGYMTHAMKLAIQFGIQNMGLKRIWAATSKQNNNAIKLLQRLQFIEVSSDAESITFEFNQNAQN
jgi:ribosomal-protein-alanine N-acetyltransferase